MFRTCRKNGRYGLTKMPLGQRFSVLTKQSSMRRQDLRPSAWRLVQTLKKQKFLQLIPISSGGEADELQKNIG
jgi:hypothetical protein